MASKACPQRELHTRLLFYQSHSATTKFINVPVCWDMTPCSLVHTYRNFGQSCHFNPQVEVKLAVNTLFFRNTSAYLPHSMAAHLRIMQIHCRRPDTLTANKMHHCMQFSTGINKLSLLQKKITKTEIYRTIILPSVMYGCETWSLTLREEHKVGLFEKRALRKICGPMREEVIEYRILHNEKLHNLY
jgi:hypothetical protein